MIDIVNGLKITSSNEKRNREYQSYYREYSRDQEGKKQAKINGLYVLKWYCQAWCFVGDLFLNTGLGDDFTFNWVMAIQ